MDINIGIAIAHNNFFKRLPSVVTCSPYSIEPSVPGSTVTSVISFLIWLIVPSTDVLALTLSNISIYFFVSCTLTVLVSPPYVVALYLANNISSIIAFTSSFENVV